MLKTILVPTDGSPLAERALPYAAALAKAAGAKLILFRAIDPLRVSLKDEPENDPASQVDAAVKKLRAEGVEAEPYIYHLYYDEVGDVILQTVRKREADLVVMSTHGRGGLGRLIYGSVADRVLRQAEVPTLLVPALGERPWPNDRPPRILVPLDGSDLAREALGPATELADELGAALHLLHVVPPPTLTYTEGYAYVAYQTDAELADSAADLDRLAETLRQAGRTVNVHVVDGYPASMIVGVAAEQGIDLIAMATHGRGGLARLVLGSVATATLQRAGLPLLLVRPAATESAVPSEAPVEAPVEIPSAEPAWVGPMVSLSLGPPELDLIKRGLGELLYLPDRDPRLAEPARRLLTRIRDEESALDSTGGSEVPAGR